MGWRARDGRTGSIEQSERVRVVPDHDGDRIVVEHLERKTTAAYANAEGGRRPKLSDRGREGERRVKTRTVGTYSLGNLLVVYEIKRQVCGWAVRERDGQGDGCAGEYGGTDYVG